MRFADGRAFAQTVNADGSPGRTLMRGSYITGPAGAPFGFYRRVPATPLATPPPPNLAADPIQPIATVEAVDRAYAISFAGAETVRGYSTYHLRLKPLRDPDLYALRDLWVDQAGSNVARLTYEQPFGSARAQITYDFAPAGTPPAWVIVGISASAGRQHVEQELHDIAFPSTEPDADFGP